MRIVFILLAIACFVFSVLNFTNFFHLPENNILYASLLFMTGIVFIAVQDYFFYRMMKEKCDEKEKVKKVK